MPLRGPTTDHAEIREWALMRGAEPAEIRPFVFDSQPAVLRFLFSDVALNQPEIIRISWENFFAQFDILGLAFIYEADPNSKDPRHHELLRIESKSPFTFEGHPV